MNVDVHHWSDTCDEKRIFLLQDCKYWQRMETWSMCVVYYWMWHLMPQQRPCGCRWNNLMDTLDALSVKRKVVSMSLGLGSRVGADSATYTPTIHPQAVVMVRLEVMMKLNSRPSRCWERKRMVLNRYANCMLLNVWEN